MADANNLENELWLTSKNNTKTMPLETIRGLANKITQSGFVMSEGVKYNGLISREFARQILSMVSEDGRHHIHLYGTSGVIIATVEPGHTQQEESGDEVQEILDMVKSTGRGINLRPRYVSY